MLPEGVARLFVPGQFVEGPWSEHYEPAESPVPNPLHPEQSANPAVQPVQHRVRRARQRPTEYPIVCTTYRLTEHFHYWTKNNPYNVQLQPEFFVEIPEELAREKGIANGDRVRVTSARGSIEGRAMVTRRIKPMQVGGRTTLPDRLPDPLGLPRARTAARVAREPRHADGRRSELVRARVQGVSRQAGEGVSSPWPIRSSSCVSPRQLVAAPGVRQLPVITKLVDTSTCIGCKACEVACQEWNDLPPETTVQMGTYQTLPDLDAELLEPDQVHRARGRERALHWLMRKDQCMHCAEPGCLVACPAPGAIVQYTNGIVDFPAGPVHRLRLLHDRLPVQRAEVQPGDQARLQVHDVRRSRVGRAAAGVREGVSDELPAVRHQGRDARSRRHARRTAQGERVSRRRRSTIRPASAARPSSRCSPSAISPSCTGCRAIPTSRWRCALEGTAEVVGNAAMLRGAPWRGRSLRAVRPQGASGAR